MPKVSLKPKAWQSNTELGQVAGEYKIITNANQIGHIYLSKLTGEIKSKTNADCYAKHISLAAIPIEFNGTYLCVNVVKVRHFVSFCSIDFEVCSLSSTV